MAIKELLLQCFCIFWIRTGLDVYKRQCLDRLFYSTAFDKTMKVGASVVCARRGGCSATFDELNKYFTISNMPVASSQYWNSIHGREKGEAEMDEEGRQTMRTLARNMVFLMKSIALGKEQLGLPDVYKRQAVKKGAMEIMTPTFEAMV